MLCRACGQQYQRAHSMPSRIVRKPAGRRSLWPLLCWKKQALPPTLGTPRRVVERAPLRARRRTGAQCWRAGGEVAEAAATSVVAATLVVVEEEEDEEGETVAAALEEEAAAAAAAAALAQQQQPQGQQPLLVFPFGLGRLFCEGAE